MHGESGLGGEALADPAQERASAGKKDAAVDDVRRELRRRPLERVTDGLDDACDGRFERALNLRGPEGDPAQKPAQLVASGDLASGASSPVASRAEPISIFTSSARSCPIKRPRSRFTNSMIASSIS